MTYNISLAAEQIGAALKEHRERKRFSMRQLAVQAGVTYPQISKIERGKVMIQLDTLLRLCNALDVSLVQILADASLRWYREMAELVSVGNGTASAEDSQCFSAKGSCRGGQMWYNFDKDKIIYANAKILRLGNIEKQKAERGAVDAG